MALHTQPARGTRLACRASPGSGQAFRLSVSVPTHQPAPGPSAPQIAGVAAMGLAVAFVLKKLSKKMGPADRIWVEGQQKGTREYSFVRDVMKNVNTTSMPSLSEEQIVAARTRRLMDRGDEKFTNLEDIELPENHPWAVRAPGKLLPGTVDRESVRAPLPKRRGKPPVSPQFLEEDDDVPQAPMRSRNPAARGEGQGARDSQWQQRNARE